MSRLRELLKNGDPVMSEPPLPDADVQRMRRRVIAAGQQRERGVGVGRPALFASGLVIFAAATIGLLSWGWGRESSENGPAGRESAGQPATRQLIFETPGGTRVIWVFNPEFRE